ncbi:PREDICTED: glutathione S-transferase T3-like [Brassica oleracea var. oleracea]|uniref:glutathione S-transferase T3-like n=1 Tax=Brassica oleracea var. oleracea TaxID=109376 RepID=UPI0006A6D243|nr:PREDICTED: glutathione S-transferase T3-like [Brassica oleracea var. oleracea]
MDSYPYNNQNTNFVDLLNSQQDIVFGFGQDNAEVSSSQVPIFGENSTAERKERRTWSPTDDIVLISSWLNTSKDPIVGNEQKSGTFWTRASAYFSASPKLAGREQRDSNHCKQRWHKINDLVGKFCGAYEAATREKSSGQNETDVLKHAHEIFFNNHHKKFKLEHAWKELRNDQKWCDLATSKPDRSSKRRKCDEAGQATTRPLGVKASKGHGKHKNKTEIHSPAGFQSMWDIKKEDLAIKERVSKIKLLEILIAKTEPLAGYEEALEKKLITELFT